MKLRLRALPVLLLLAMLALAGCREERRFFFQYDDEPYLRDYLDRGAPYALQKLDSNHWNSREIAARALGVHARLARESGAEGEAREYVAALLRRYGREKAPEVRVAIVGVALRDAGLVDDAVAAFLRERIVEGVVTVDASRTLAALGAPGAYEAIEPLLVHPRFETRYEAALSLSLLDDPRVSPRLLRLAEEMRPPLWPKRIHSLPLSQCAENLRARALTGGPFHRSAEIAP